MNKASNKTFAPVSVIIPCYCCCETLEKACLSVVNQSLVPSQIILVEDASDDDGKTFEKINTLSRIIEDIGGVECIKLFLENNEGPGGARNHGWDIARNDYIAFLDADDTWHPSKIEVQYSWMQANPLIDLSCHRSVLFERYHCDELLALEVKELKFGNMLYRNQIMTRTAMLKRSSPNRFQKGVRFSEDYRLWLNMIAGKSRAVLLNVELASSYRPDYSRGGQSSKLWKMECSELSIYWDLYCNNQLILPSFVSCSLFSLAKFFLRCLKSYIFTLNDHFHCKP